MTIDTSFSIIERIFVSTSENFNQMLCAKIGLHSISMVLIA